MRLGLGLEAPQTRPAQDLSPLKTLKGHTPLSTAPAAKAPSSASARQDGAERGTMGVVGIRVESALWRYQFQSRRPLHPTLGLSSDCVGHGN